MTSVIGLLSTALACPVYRSHLKLGSGFREPDTSVSLVDPTGINPTENGVCEARGAGVFARFWTLSSPGPRYQGFGFVHIDQTSLSFHVSLPEEQLLCSCFSDPESMTSSSAYRLSQGHHVRIPCEKASTTVTDTKGWGKSLGEEPFSHWIIHLGCKQQAFCPCYFHTCSVWGIPATPQRHACEESTK